jgi:hypothetical protein
MADSGWYKEVSRGLIDSVQHGQISYALVMQELDKPSARAPELVL